MKQIITIFSLLLLSGLAFASPYTDSSSEEESGQEQDQFQNQYQDQEQSQDQYQDQTQTQTTEQANEQTVNFSSPSTIRNTASAIPPNVFASAPCYTGASAGAGVPGFNISGGKTTLDPQCEIRETVRLLLAAGEQELAVELLCTTDAAAGMAKCKSTLNVRQRVRDLEGRIQTILKERGIDKQKCEESKDRITEACRK
jgi:type II secretory pathway pseudopilin PulG